MSSLKKHLLRTTGMVPTDPLGWLYVARGFFSGGEYTYTIEAAQHCFKSPETIAQAQQLLAFALLELEETESSHVAFIKSARLGNETDWQMIVELGIDMNDSLNDD
jgi:hypothetical protein